MQVTLGNMKSFGKQAKADVLCQIWVFFFNACTLDRIFHLVKMPIVA